MCKIISSIILGFVLLGGVAFAQTSNIQAPSTDVAAPSPSAVQTKPISPSNVSPTNTTPTNTTTVRKCGVNTYVVNNECGVGAFKNAYVQCYDGYEENLGGESSCKSSETWQKYAQEICANRCSVVGAPQPALTPKPLPTPTPIPAPANIGKPIAVCYIPDKLTKDYNQLILDLRKAEEAGDKETSELIIKKITALKMKIESARKECLANTAQPRSLVHQELHRPPVAIAINRCQEVSQWENKIAYYQKLAALSDVELKEQTGFSREEVEKILADLPNGLTKVKSQCQVQTNTAVAKSVAVSQTAIAEPIKPVVIESGQEISDYYKAKIEKITSDDSDETQIQNLQSLKSEIDELIAKLLKGRKEIEVSEFNNVVSEIKVSRGEIKADDVAIKTTDKKIFVNIGNSSVSVAPTSRQVLIQDKNLEVTASEVSLKDNALRVGNSEVKLAASKVAENLGLNPQSAELKEENARAVYKLKVIEPRKLFGFVPIRITKTLTADAESSDLLDESRPWYSFLTTK